ncbi:MAG: hypothetical protein KGI00_03445 [Candidatus Micrarchaeota archaeon]|nr:hypothetical protein [Candidatus Micrarchaeota archaeon]MDE1849759.1 hypothetical protein [Candidatus Micrarchaeota archaeon]
MARTTQIEQQRAAPVFLSDKRVPASEAEAAVPKGYRLATLQEVSLRYKHDAHFRQELFDNGLAWTSQQGLRSSGHHKITQEGTFVGVPENRYNEIASEDRSYHYPGNGRVAVDINSFDIFDIENRALKISANVKSLNGAGVAYVKEDNLNISTNGTGEIRIPKDKFNAAKEAFRIVEPTIRQDLVVVFRELFGD